MELRPSLHHRGREKVSNFSFKFVLLRFIFGSGADGGGQRLFFSATHSWIAFLQTCCYFLEAKTCFMAVQFVCTWLRVGLSPLALVGQESAFRRQSRSSAWSRGDRWGSPPAPAGSPRPRRPWSSRSGWSGTCRCQCRGRWSRFLLRRHTRKQSQTGQR